MLICAECQAYFCLDCLHAIKDYSFCPAARLLGVKEHELKFIKLLPPKPNFDLNINDESKKTKTIKILPSRSIKVLEEHDKKKQKKN